MRPAENYRAARRNQFRELGWQRWPLNPVYYTGGPPAYVPAEARGKQYRPNGQRERARRRRQMGIITLTEAVERGLSVETVDPYRALVKEAA